MTRIKRRLLIASGLVIFVALVLGAFFQVSTRVALERAEALQFRRMQVTRLEEENTYQFFYVTNRVSGSSDENGGQPGRSFGTLMTQAFPRLTPLDATLFHTP